MSSLPLIFPAFLHYSLLTYPNFSQFSFIFFIWFELIPNFRQFYFSQFNFSINSLSLFQLKKFYQSYSSNLFCTFGSSFANRCKMLSLSRHPLVTIIGTMYQLYLFHVFQFLLVKVVRIGLCVRNYLFAYQK